MSTKLETVRYELARIRREVFAARAALMPNPPREHTLEADCLVQGIGGFLEGLDNDLKHLQSYVGGKNGD